MQPGLAGVPFRHPCQGLRLLPKPRAADRARFRPPLDALFDLFLLQLPTAVSLTGCDRRRALKRLAVRARFEDREIPGQREAESKPGGWGRDELRFARFGWFGRAVSHPAHNTPISRDGMAFQLPRASHWTRPR